LIECVYKRLFLRAEITPSLNIQLRVLSFVMRCRFVWNCQSFRVIEAIDICSPYWMASYPRRPHSRFLCCVELKVQYIKVFNSL